jgi:hypothetical protein
LWATLLAKKAEIGAFKAEMKKDPVYKLFSEEAGNELGDILRKLWQGEDNFLEIMEEEEKKQRKPVETTFQK